MLNYLKHLVVFVRVAELESFTKAGKSLQITPPAVSKHIKVLEEKLGVSLLDRNTRKVYLTESGRHYFSYCQKITTLLEEAEKDIQGLQKSPRGGLRLFSPVTFGEQYLSPALASFSIRYPDIHMEVELSNRSIDMLEEGFDLVIGEPNMVLKNQDLITQKLITKEMTLCASPSYLKQHGTPQNPEDLKLHQMMGLTPHLPKNVWRYKKNNQQGVISFQSCFNSNNSEVLLQAALKGRGIVALSEETSGKEIDKGTLVRVLPEYITNTMSGKYYFIFPQYGKHSAKIRVFIDFIKKEFSGQNE